MELDRGYRADGALELAQALTGQGDAADHPIPPAINLAASPRLARAWREVIDQDRAGQWRHALGPDRARDQALALLARSANGGLTVAEAFGHRGFALTRLHRSA